MKYNSSAQKRVLRGNKRRRKVTSVVNQRRRVGKLFLLEVKFVIAG